jgi:hypothetical protein
MKHFTKLAAAALAASMILAVASCGMAPEPTEAATEASVTTSEETTTSETTTEETTTETSEETSEETEESAKVTAPEGETFDSEEYPFDISEDTFVSAVNEIGGTVYYDVDDFMTVCNNISAADSDALDKYHNGIAVVSSGDGISDMIDTFASTTASKDDEFIEHLTKLCVFTAAEAGNMDYQVIVMYYEVDDPAIIEDWYAKASSEYVENVDSVTPATDYYDSGVSLYNSGESKALLAKLVLNDQGAEKYGEVAGSGAYTAFYVNGTSGLLITVSDFTEEEAGFGMIEDFCDEMGLLNPCGF